MSTQLLLIFTRPPMKSVCFLLNENFSFSPSRLLLYKYHVFCEFLDVDLTLTRKAISLQIVKRVKLRFTTSEHILSSSLHFPILRVTLTRIDAQVSSEVLPNI